MSIHLRLLWSVLIEMTSPLCVNVLTRKLIPRHGLQGPMPTSFCFVWYSAWIPSQIGAPSSRLLSSYFWTRLGPNVYKNAMVLIIYILCSKRASTACSTDLNFKILSAIGASITKSDESNFFFTVSIINDRLSYSKNICGDSALDLTCIQDWILLCVSCREDSGFCSGEVYRRGGEEARCEFVKKSAICFGINDISYVLWWL